MGYGTAKILFHSFALGFWREAEQSFCGGGIRIQDDQGRGRSGRQGGGKRGQRMTDSSFITII